MVDVINREAEKSIKDEDLATYIDTKINNGETILRADDIRKEYEESTGV